MTKKETDDKQGRALIHFVGAGPGAPDLITLRGKKLLDEADVVVYAGSLVNHEILKGCRADARLFNSAGMNLAEIVEVMVAAAGEGKLVVRLQTGDPSFYSALAEQADALDEAGAAFQVVPGVSSAFASAASLKKELTMPETTQTIIFTRMEGRTPVPKAERLRLLASHGSTLCIFLSASMIDKVVEELTIGGYGLETPAAVVYRATWPDEKQVVGTLADIAARTKEAGITKHAMILVSRTLGKDAFDGIASKLYDREFGHEFRREER